MVCAIAGFCNPVTAGNISIQLKTTTNISKESLEVEFEVTNLGNEPAYEIEPVLWPNGNPSPLQDSPVLSPGQIFETTYTSTQHLFQEEGSYILPLHISYRDSLGSIFKLSYLVSFEHGTRSNSGLLLAAEKVVLPEDASVTLTLTNTDPWIKQIHLSEVTSMSVQFDLPASPFELQANETKIWDLKVEHDILWPNTYIHYVVASYLHNKTHYSAFVAVETQVRQSVGFTSRVFTKRNMTWALFALITFALLFGYGPLLIRKIWQKPS
jgi:hypothetical protein